MLRLIDKIIHHTEFKPKLALEQCFVRNCLHVIVVFTILIAQYLGGIGVLDKMIVNLGVGYILICIIFSFVVFRYPKYSKIISITGVISDTFIICLIMFMGSDKEAALYGLLLFLVIANGLRFGKNHMQFANLICIIGFLVVILFNEFWQNHILLAVGNMIWLILIPAHLTNLLTRLESAVSTAEAANSAKTQFIANMSHEIRTPLTAIVGFGKLLLDRNLPAPKSENAIQSIIRNGEHLSSIVNDILDISKIESGKLEVDCREISIFDVTREIEFMFLSRIKGNDLRFTVNYHYPLPETINSDSLRIKQILINLCSNAIKFTEKGEVVLDVSFDEHKNEITFSVSDTGIGLTEAQMKKIFSQYSQADATITRKYGGTGLGLPISTKLAEMLGGNLRVNSIENKGSQFSFSVSVGEVVNNGFVHSLPVHNKNDNSSLSHQFSFEGSILLVEDVIDNQVLITSILEDMGATVDVAENGKIALEKTEFKSYDLILMDLQMPIMGGIESIRKMRDRSYIKPIVILTANVIQNEERESKNFKCQGFLSKPIDEVKMQNIVQLYLRTSAIKKTEIVSDEVKADENNSVIISTLTSDKSSRRKAISDSFATQLLERITAIEAALYTEDTDTFKLLVHNMKGLGGNMGFDVLTEKSKEMETALGNIDSLKIIISELYEIEKKITAGLSL